MDGIIIVARLESERLPQKHLKQVLGVPLIQWLINRLQHNFSEEIKSNTVKIIVATPNTEANNGFNFLTHITSVTIFKGDEKNIPLRVMQCCNSLNIENAVVVDGDNFLVSMEAIKAVISKLSQNCRLVKTAGLPLGMNVTGWKAQFLKDVLDTAKKHELLESGWGRIFRDFDFEKIEFPYSSLPVFNELRFTTDYPDDLWFITQMIEHLNKKVITATAEELINTAVENKFYLLNSHLCKKYWDNFYKKIEEEKLLNHE
jgi:spore coat polysaccharide biosynthesis protein SpsF